MSKKIATALFALLALSACASSAPKVIQASAKADDIRVTVGLATQIEMPRDTRVQSVIVGNPAILTADQAGDVVNLVAKGGAGETNLIIRAKDEDGDVKVFQYNVTVQER